MTDGPVLLVTGAALAAVGAATVAHRRDQMGLASGSAVLVAAVTVALVGFSAAAPSRSGGAQLQAFAVIVELLGALMVFAMAALGVVLRRRTASDLVALAQTSAGREGPLAGAGPEPQADSAPGASDSGSDEPSGEPTGEPEEPQGAEPAEGPDAGVEG